MDNTGNVCGGQGQFGHRENHTGGINWVVSTIAGSPKFPALIMAQADAAQFSIPDGLTMDTNGNLYVVDLNNNTIRKMIPVGTNWSA